MLHKTQRMADGSIVIGSMSTEHEKQPVDASGAVVRAQLHIGAPARRRSRVVSHCAYSLLLLLVSAAGLCLRRTADGRGTSATYVISSDPQGSIPAFIRRKARVCRCHARRAGADRRWF
jgi:hypothetical protein